MPNGTSERSALIEHCGVGGSVRKGTLYPITLWLKGVSAQRRLTSGFATSSRRLRRSGVNNGLI